MCDPGHEAGEERSPQENSGESSFHEDSSCSSSVSCYSSSASSCDFWPLLISPGIADDSVKCVLSLTPSKSAVCSIAVSERFIYTGCQDGEVCCWSKEDGSVLVDRFGKKGKGAIKSIISIQVKGESIVATAQNKKVKVWKLDLASSSGKKHKLIARLPTLGDLITKIGRRVRIRRHHTYPWNAHYDVVTSVAAAAGDRDVLYSASWDRSIKTWSLQSFTCLDSIAAAHDDAINSLQLWRRSGGGALLFSASSDCTVRAWEAEGRLSLAATLRHKAGVNAIAVAPSPSPPLGCWLYAACRDGSIAAWELRGDEEAKMKQVMRGHVRAVLCIATGGGGEIVCSGSADGTVRVWRRGGGGAGAVHRCCSVLGLERVPVRCIAVSSSNSRAVVYGGGADGRIKAWLIQ